MSNSSSKSNSLTKILMPIMAMLLLFVLILWVAGVFDDKIAPGLKEMSPTDLTQVFKVEATMAPVLEPVSASVEAKQATLISSRMMARITSVNVRSGDRVEQGQILIALDKRDLEARAQQVKAQIRSIEARLKEASQGLERAKTLHKQGMVAIAELERSQANFSTLTADLAAAKQQLQESETAVSFSEIRSPINGVIVDRFAEPGDTAAPGSKLLAVYNPLSLRVEANVRETVALTMQSGQSLLVEIPSLKKTLAGQVEEIVPAADPGSRSFLMKVSIPYDSELLPGIYARLLVPVAQAPRILVPADRVVQVGQLDVVWVIKNNQIQRRFVRVGDANVDGMVPVYSGLSSGDNLLLPQQ